MVTPTGMINDNIKIVSHDVSGLVDSEPGSLGFHNRETENVRIRPAVNVVGLPSSSSS